MIQYLYPKLMALHDLTNDVCIPDPAGTQMRLPSLMRCSYIWMENNGIYMIGSCVLIGVIRLSLISPFRQRRRDVSMDRRLCFAAVVIGLIWR